MLDLREFSERRAADSLRGRVGRYKVGILMLELFEFAEQPVIIGVGNYRPVKYVIVVVVLVELGAQRFDARRD